MSVELTTLWTLSRNDAVQNKLMALISDTLHKLLMENTFLLVMSFIILDLFVVLLRSMILSRSLRVYLTFVNFLILCFDYKMMYGYFGVLTSLFINNAFHLHLLYSHQIIPG